MRTVLVVLACAFLVPTLKADPRQWPEIGLPVFQPNFNAEQGRLTCLARVLDPAGISLKYYGDTGPWNRRTSDIHFTP
jgi:hypothetical protein